MSYSKKRSNEEFRENLISSLMEDLWTDERVMNDRLLGRMVDNDAIAKCRLSRYGQQSKAIAKATQRTGDYDDMQKARDSNKAAGKGYDARDFDLDQNVAEIFFNAYGEGFYGEPFPSKDNGYTCRCGLKMMMSLKMTPERCPRCGRETPLGQLYKDRILKR